MKIPGKQAKKRTEFTVIKFPNPFRINGFNCICGNYEFIVFLKNNLPQLST
jgi:hypothetical protein